MIARVRFPDGKFVVRGGAVPAVLGFNVSHAGDRLPLVLRSASPTTHVYMLPTPAELGAGSGLVKAILVRAWASFTGPVGAFLYYRQAYGVGGNPASFAYESVRMTRIPTTGAKVRACYEFELNPLDATTLTLAWNPDLGWAAGEPYAEAIGFRSAGGP